MNQQETQATQTRLNTLRNNTHYAHLSTLSSDGNPQASYAPCLITDQGIHVFLSQLSAHCQNLLQDNRAGVLLIADEQNARNPFARQRISYECSAITIASSAEPYQPTLDQLAKKHGNTVDLLRQLPDFILFNLKPNKGTYVEGFGKAYELTGENLNQLTHIDEKTIRSRH